jgi:hypothetical protein
MLRSAGAETWRWIRSPPNGCLKENWARDGWVTSPEVSPNHSGRAPGAALRPVVIAGGIFLLGCLLYLWQLSVPRFLQFYDSGVYMASAMHLVSGALPYKDFTFVQPPGILYLLTPEALLGRVFGTHDAFLLSRIAGSLVTALDATLLAWLVRARGRGAMVVAGVGLLLTPVAIFVSSSVRLEPYCICFVLLGSLVALTSTGGPRQVSTARLVAAGALFGVAAVVEFWAFYPFLAMAICLAPQVRRRIWAFVGAAASGVVALSLPFLVSAPGRYISLVFIDQLERKSNGSTGGESLMWRLIDMTGFSATSISPTGAQSVVAFVVLGVLVAAAARVRVGEGAVDVFLLLATVVTIGGLMAGPDAFTDFGYFAAPFLLGLVAVSLARIGGPVRQWLARAPVSRRMRYLASWSFGLTGILLLVALCLYQTMFYSSYSRLSGVTPANASPISRYVPAGSCVLYDDVAFGVEANRLQSSEPHCPLVVDPTGIWMSWGYELKAPAPAFLALWRSYFRASHYVVTQNDVTSPLMAIAATSHYPAVPWTKSLQSWFEAHFHLLVERDGNFIYVNDSRL